MMTKRIASTKGHVSRRVGTAQVTPTKLGVFCRTEVNEKTARPRTFSPGDIVALCCVIVTKYSNCALVLPRAELTHESAQMATIAELEFGKAIKSYFHLQSVAKS